MTQQKCSTCRWWTNRGPQLANGTRDPSASFETGTCQVRAPVVAETSSFPVTVFPVTHGSRFCGEWKPTGGGGPDDGESVIAFPLGETANRVAA